MSMITHQGESSIEIDCLDCDFNVVIWHNEYHRQRPKLTLSEELEEAYSLIKNR